MFTVNNKNTRTGEYLINLFFETFTKYESIGEVHV